MGASSGEAVPVRLFASNPEGVKQDWALAALSSAIRATTYMSVAVRDEMSARTSLGRDIAH